MKERYGQWAGNREGTRGDPTKCSMEISEPGRGMLFYQCSRNGTVEEDGELWCKTHAPSSVRARAEKSRKKYEDDCERRAKAYPKNVRKAAIEECIEIADSDGSFSGDRIAKALRARLKMSLLLGRESRED